MRNGRTVQTAQTLHRVPDWTRKRDQRDSLMAAVTSADSRLYHVPPAWEAYGRSAPERWAQILAGATKWNNSGKRKNWRSRASRSWKLQCGS